MDYTFSFLAHPELFVIGNESDDEIASNHHNTPDVEAEGTPLQILELNQPDLEAGINCTKRAASAAGSEERLLASSSAVGNIGKCNPGFWLG